LEHQYCTSEHRFLREEFEDERRTDLIGDVGYANVKERQFCCQNISGNQDELMCEF
jgi:hypothetical protein